MDPITKVYLNTSKDDYNVIGIGEVPAGGQVSITSTYLPPIVLENYPGLEDITDTPASTTSSTSSSSSSGGGSSS